MILGVKKFFLVLTTLYSANILANKFKFNMTKQPTKNQWVSFLAKDKGWKQKTWIEYNKIDDQFIHWNWKWKLGWIRICSISKFEFCDRFLRKMLIDKGFLIRSQAANGIAQFYSKKHISNELLKELIEEYNKTRNRKKKNLSLVRKNILYALKEISSKRSLKVGIKLSKRNAKTRLFWEQLNK